jgi:ligand-binding sensor domain-containing protein
MSFADQKLICTGWMPRWVIVFVVQMVGSGLIGAHAQAPLQLSFRHLTQQQGLPSGHCSQLFKDSRHFWWIGTQTGGIVRFDGHVHKTYASFTGSMVVNILEDKNANLWIGTNKGLNFYDRRTDQFRLVKIPVIAHLSDCWVRPIYFDAKGRLWFFAACQWGLYIFDPATQKCTLVSDRFSESCKIFPNKPHQKPRFILTNASEGFIKIDLKGDTVGAVHRYFDSQRTDLLPLAEVKNHYFAEHDSLIWLGTDLGLIAFNPLGLRYQLYNRYLNVPVKHVTAIASIGQKRYLVGTAEDGLFLFDYQQGAFIQQFKHHLAEANSLATNYIEKIFVDDHQNVLVSVLGYGIDYTNLKQIRLPFYLSKSTAFSLGLSNNHLTCATQLHDGAVWFGTKTDGIVTMNPTTRQVVKWQKASLQSKYVHHLLEDSQQRLWIASKAGLELWQNNRLRVLLSNESVNHVAELNKDVFFVSTHRNVYVVERKNGNWHLGTIKQVIQEGHRYNLFVWVHPQTRQPYLSTESGSYWCELIPKQGQWAFGKTLWFPCTIVDAPFEASPQALRLCSTEGIIDLDLGKWTTQVNDQVSGKQLNKVIKRNDGTEWYISEKEVCSYNQQSQKKERFSVADGLSTTYFETNACIQLRDGQLILGGTNGFNLFDPARIPPPLAKGKLLLTGVKFNDRPVAFGDGTLPLVPYNENTVSFEFVAQHFGFADDEANVMEYRLDNYDSQWLSASAKGFVRYAQLPAGEYVFNVRYCGSAQVAVQIPLRVAAPVWGMWWFRTLLVAVLLGIVYVIYRSKIQEEKQRSHLKQMRSEAEMKAFRAQMNPHFVFNCMNTIDGYILSNRPAEASAFLQKFSRLIRLVLENSQQNLISLADELKALNLYIRLEEERMQHRFVSYIEVAPSITPEAYYLPPLLVQPFVENAILHGLRHKTDGPGLLQINISHTGQHLVVVIEDNGVGLVASAEINRQREALGTTSMGISVTGERIENLKTMYGKNADFRIVDLATIGKTGTRIIIQLPLLKQDDSRID